MAKRKRASAATSVPKDAADFRPGNAKIAINSYKDVADSEDEFHLQRDKILLEDGPNLKRRRRVEEDAIEPSDEEVLAYDDSEAEDDDDDDDNDGAEDPQLVERGSEEERSHASDGEDPLSGWGTSKGDYYNADEIETEEQARQEEEEARRLQKERRKALSEADFVFDEDDWKTSARGLDATEQDGAFTELLPKLQVTEDMSTADRLKLLKSRYPEFEPLSRELLDLQPLHKELAAGLENSLGNDGQRAMAIKYRALSAYLGSLALYFAILISAQADDGRQQPLAAHLLREHEVMDSLVQCRERWNQVKDIQLLSPPASDDLDEEIPTVDEADFAASLKDAEKLAKKKRKASKADSASLARRAARLEQTEQALADLESELNATKKQRPRKSKAQKDDADSDIGDEEEMDAHEAAEKARRKKSLRFYTSQIAQKANKRANAGRAAGGDDDLPHRERLRDRQERLNREAEKRGRKQKDGDLGVVSDDDAGITNKEREQLAGNGADEDDDFARELHGKVEAKKLKKQQRDEAYRKAKEEGGRVVPQAMPSVGPDGRREIGFKIEKNKGLTPKRNKLNKNPRAKKRAKYEEKKKKLASVKAVYKGGEGRGGYGGELTGIKKGLVKSTKL